jgi:hypothetical protein
MTIKATLTRLEAKPGGKPIKHYLWVRGQHGETKEAAIERSLRERGITLDDVGYLWLWGADCCGTVDYKNYVRKEDLIGYFDAAKKLRTWLDSINGKSLGPPSERPGFQGSVRRREEIRGACRRVRAYGGRHSTEARRHGDAIRASACAESWMPLAALDTLLTVSGTVNYHLVSRNSVFIKKCGCILTEVVTCGSVASCIDDNQYVITVH